MSMKLVILGLLMEGDSHPYEIRQKMKDRHMHNHMKMLDGSLYYAIDQLNKKGFVDAIEVVRDSNRPDKTIYRITDAGKEKFQELLMEQLDQPYQVLNPMYTALKFASHGNDKEISASLERKIVECQQHLARMESLYDEHIPLVPRAVLHMMRGYCEHARTELHWLKELHRDALAGRLKEVGQPLDVQKG